MKVDLIDYMGSDLTVVNAARVSFNKRKEELDVSDEKLIRYLAAHSHWTPFAHPSITVRIKAPIFVARQLYRHKVGFVENEVSRRYVDEEPEFFFPDKWRGRPTGGAKQGSSDEEITALYQYSTDDGKTVSIHPTDKYKMLLDLAEEVYSEFLVEGIAPELARMVLPQSMYTEWYWTGSLASFARVYKQRIDPHAQKESQDIARMLGEKIEPLFPVSWKVLTE